MNAVQTVVEMNKVVLTVIYDCVNNGEINIRVYGIRSRDKIDITFVA